jgi:hypothetical protein
MTDSQARPGPLFGGRLTGSLALSFIPSATVDASYSGVTRRTTPRNTYSLGKKR